MVNKKQNMHTHTIYSDGKMKPRELIELAVANNIRTLGITDHIELPGLDEGIFPDFFTKWGKGFYTDANYSSLNALKKEYSCKIDILVGAEFDWLRNHEEYVLSKTVERKYDRDAKLVSIHNLPVGNKYLPIDVNDEYFRELIGVYGGVREVVEEYYREIRAAVRTDKFGAVGHINMISIWNKNDKFFSENAEWCKRTQMKTLETIAKGDMNLEINTAGIEKYGQPFINQDMMKYARQLGIPLQVGTDVHISKEINTELDNIYDITGGLLDDN